MRHHKHQHIVIVGGGVVGCAIAYFLRHLSDGQVAVTVVERDSAYVQASSALSAGSIRQQFSTPTNIDMSAFGIDFLHHLGEHLAVDGDVPDIGLVERGYLFLASPAGQDVLQANHAVQRARGADVALLTPAALQARFPWLAVDDLAGGSLGLSGEGWFDGYSLLQAFRRKARALGADFVGAAVVGLDLDGGQGRIVGARLADGRQLAADTLVNAAGPWAAAVAAMAGIDLPVRARRRSVFCFSSPAVLPDCPLVIDPSGAYFRPEGAQFICGISPPPGEDPDDAPLEVEHRRFDDVLWPILAARVPQFEALRPQRSWAGYYEYNTVDQNAIIGRHPQTTNLIFANGFSGHGLQHAPATGRGIAELILFGGYRSLDLSPFAFERLAAGTPLIERNVV